MQHSGANRRDSADFDTQTGGTIPGTPDALPAFSLSGPSTSPIPVLIAVPHAGRCYPEDVLARLRQPDAVALRLEDRLVDHLAQAVAQATGARLLVAHAPRAMIDLNRAETDIDWDMLGLSTPPEYRLAAPNARARSGLGLVPRRLPATGDIWRGRLTRAELDERIARIHRPYHATLHAELAALQARWGAALLIDLHSMPSLPRVDGVAGAELVLGDRFGASCHGMLVASAFAHFAAQGWRAAHNRPYAGGYGLDRHGAPRKGTHAIQLEIDRATYLDVAQRDCGEGFAGMAEMLVALVRRLAGDVAQMGGRGDPAREAAE